MVHRPGLYTRSLVEINNAQTRISYYHTQSHKFYSTPKKLCGPRYPDVRSRCATLRPEKSKKAK
ncbi:hypothetical protein RSAG8_06643, partial [Rhizoctonia solani AG-8 WAC10335]